MPEVPCRPRISVVISTYNSAALLHACLQQMLRQTALAECEIIVIDSGSQQDEAAVCAALRPAFPRLVYERTPRETIYKAWNRALALAQGEYFVNANTDDALHPNALAVLSRGLDEHAEAAIAYGDWVWSDVPNAPFPWHASYRRIKHTPYHPSLALMYCYTGCTQFWRTAKLREIGGFNAGRWAAGDYEALAALVRRRWAAVYAPLEVSAFYQNPAGLSLSSNRSIQEFHEIRNALRQTLEISAIFDVDEADHRSCAAGWMGLAHRALRVCAPWESRPEPDDDYARWAALKALALDPFNPYAQRFLDALRPRGGSFEERILRSLRGTRPARALPEAEVPEPAARVPPLTARPE